MAKRIKLSDLTAEGRRILKQIAEEYSIDTTDPAAVLLLRQVAHCHDRMLECRAIVADEGPVVLDRFSEKKPHPMLGVERDARTQMLCALKALNLDLVDVPSAGPGRPPGR